MPFGGIPNTPQNSEWHSSKVRCEIYAKRNKETIPWVPEDIFFWSIFCGEAALTRRKAPRRKKQPLVTGARNLISMREISSEIELGHRLDTPMSSCSMQPIRAIVILLIPCGYGSIQSVTQFNFRTDFSHGNEVACSCDQRLFFFSSALCASWTRLRREISIRKKYPLEPRVKKP